jgi:O-succinylbenzoic acid--CoA ligase
MVTLNGDILPHRQVRLADDGEIFVSGPMLFQGYLGQTKPDWFATGDLGKLENGKLIIIGRKDWMFISGGENIQPEEIERELLRIPEVIEAVVIAKDDPEFGKRPFALVKTVGFFDQKRMQTILSDRLPKFKIPIGLYLLDELPKKNDFKIDRFICAQLINGQLDRNMSVQKNEPYL